MPLTRKFLGWSRPFLPMVADHLLAEYAHGGLDLGQLTVVVPGRRAGRRLTELLIERTVDLAGFIPPQIETLGRLPESLYEPKQPFASHTVQILAWVQALQKVPSETRLKIAPSWPEGDRFQLWRDTGELLWRQHRELAADGLSFSDVHQHGQDLEGFPDADRWAAMAEVQHEYLAILDQLELWDRQTARLFAIKHQECHADQEFVLVGTADLNRALKEMLSQVNQHVHSLIFAPENQAHGFDDFGCLIPSEWEQVRFDLKDSQIRVADSVSDQSLSLVEVLDEYSSHYSADQITIGMADERAISEAGRTLDLVGVETRWFEGRSLSETSPFQFLQALGRFLATRRYTELAELIRHPLISSWAQQRDIESGYIEELDTYYERHLPSRIGFWLGNEEKVESLKSLVESIEQETGLLSSSRAAWSDWCEPWLRIVDSFYAHCEFDRENAADMCDWQSLSRICEELQRVALIPPELAPQVTASEAIQLVLSLISSESIAAPHADDAVEMLGWLELPLDDRPALTVSSFNDGNVPKSINSDLFLPNRLRMHLGIDDNQRRYARDAFALQTLIASRECVTLICGRRDSQGNPLRPSRLLFDTPDNDLAKRVLHVVDEVEPAVELSLRATGGNGDLLRVPQPAHLDEPPTVMSVTSFRDYLQCPYRFYLKHILRLQHPDDQQRELNALLFGNLAHDVLEDFARGPLRDSMDPDAIRAHLRELLDQKADRILGRERLPAVDVQIAQLQLRLDAFAEWQARDRYEGWRIQDQELNLEVTNPLFKFDEYQLRLRGRIDRLDRNDNTGEWRVVDYKTSESGNKPEKTHRKRGEWVDLQLPLYRHLVVPERIPAGETIRFGYVALPKDVAGVGWLQADWSEEDLAEADSVAREVARAVCRQEFWPPAVPAPLFDDFPRICSASGNEPDEPVSAESEVVG